MSESTTYQRPFSVSTILQHDDPDVLVMTFVTKRQDSEPPKQFIVEFDLSTNQERLRGGFDGVDRGLEDQMMAEVQTILAMRRKWIERVTDLVDQVERVADEEGWKSRRLTKKLADPQVGEYIVPVLAMQKDLCETMLMIHGRSAPGVDGGVAGIYLMPSYDDAVSLYFYDGQWNMHHRDWQTTAVATVREGVVTPLNDQTLASVLQELHRHAS